LIDVAGDSIFPEWHLLPDGQGVSSKSGTGSMMIAYIKSGDYEKR